MSGLSTPIQPATLDFTAGGTPRSAAFGDTYHSIDGSLLQARQVFLAGNGLPQRWQGRDCFTILETGFGLGLNFLTAWQAWRDDPQRCARLHFVSVELHPFNSTDLSAFYRAWPELAPLAEELLARWPALTPGSHRLLLNGGRVTLTLILGDARLWLPRQVLRADAVFLDGFAPDRNPELWSPPLLKALTRLCAPAATLATWCVAGAVRQALIEAGWALKKHPGIGSKFHTLTGELQRPSRSLWPERPPRERRALVIGAGIAGAAMAERLAARGWQVTVLERNAAPAQEASGNPAGLAHPVISRDDNLTARLSRASHLYAMNLLEQLAAEGLAPRWAACGLLQLAQDATQEAEQRSVCEKMGFPPGYVRYVDRAEAAALAGCPVIAGGWYFPRAGWLSPPTVVAALLASHGGAVTVRYQTPVTRLERRDGEWHALDADGHSLAAAPELILANALDAARLAPQAALPLSVVRGQVSTLSAGALPPLKMALCGDGYVTPDAGGLHCFGATFDFDDDDPNPRIEGHRSNLAHLQALLPTLDTSAFDPAQMAGRVGFRTVTPDRLPLAGPLADIAAPMAPGVQLPRLPRIEGLWCLTGLGSRGMVWAPLAAELVACHLSGEPMPVERELMDAIDPGRFHLRASRRAEGALTKDSEV